MECAEPSEWVYQVTMADLGVVDTFAGTILSGVQDKIRVRLASLTEVSDEPLLTLAGQGGGHFITKYQQLAMTIRIPPLSPSGFLQPDLGGDRARFFF